MQTYWPIAYLLLCFGAAALFLLWSNNWRWPK